jgi:hypothetical protein
MGMGKIPPDSVSCKTTPALSKKLHRDVSKAVPSTVCMAQLVVIMSPMDCSMDIKEPFGTKSFWTQALL